MARSPNLKLIFSHAPSFPIEQVSLQEIIRFSDFDFSVLGGIHVSLVVVWVISAQCSQSSHFEPTMRHNLGVFDLYHQSFTLTYLCAVLVAIWSFVIASAVEDKRYFKIILDPVPFCGRIC